MNVFAFIRLVRPVRHLAILIGFVCYAWIVAGFADHIRRWLGIQDPWGLATVIFAPIVVGGAIASFFSAPLRRPFAWTIPGVRMSVICAHALAIILVGAGGTALEKAHGLNVPVDGAFGLCLAGLSVYLWLRPGLKTQALPLMAIIFICGLFPAQIIGWVSVHSFVSFVLGVAIVASSLGSNYGRERLRQLALEGGTSWIDSIGDMELSTRRLREVQTRAVKKALSRASAEPPPAIPPWKERIRQQWRRKGFRQVRGWLELPAAAFVIGYAITWYSGTKSHPVVGNILSSLIILALVSLACAVSGRLGFIPRHYREPISRRERLRRARVFFRKFWTMNVTAGAAAGVSFALGAACARGSSFASEARELGGVLIILDFIWIPLFVWSWLATTLARRKWVRKGTSFTFAMGFLLLIHSDVMLSSGSAYHWMISLPGVGVAAIIGGFFCFLSYLTLKSYFLTGDFIRRSSAGSSAYVRMR